MANEPCILFKTSGMTFSETIRKPDELSELASIVAEFGFKNINTPDECDGARYHTFKNDYRTYPVAEVIAVYPALSKYDLYREVYGAHMMSIPGAAGRFFIDQQHNYTGETHGGLVSPDALTRIFAKCGKPADSTSSYLYVVYRGAYRTFMHRVIVEEDGVEIPIPLDVIHNAFTAPKFGFKALPLPVPDKVAFGLDLERVDVDCDSYALDNARIIVFHDMKVAIKFMVIEANSYINHSLNRPDICRWIEKVEQDIKKERADSLAKQATHKIYDDFVNSLPPRPQDSDSQFAILSVKEWILCILGAVVCIVIFVLLANYFKGC